MKQHCPSCGKKFDYEQHGWIAADGEQFRVSDWKKSDLPATEADF